MPSCSADSPQGEITKPTKGGNLPMAGENVVSTIKSWIGGLSSVALSLLGLAIVLQVLFGPDVVFVPVDVIWNIQGLVTSLGSAGLAGLITVGVIYWILKND